MWIHLFIWSSKYGSSNISSKRKWDGPTNRLWVTMKKKESTSPITWFLYPNWLDWLPWHHVYQFHMVGGGDFSNSQKRMTTKVKAETSRVPLLGECIWLQHFVILCYRREVNKAKNVKRKMYFRNNIYKKKVWQKKQIKEDNSVFYG